MRPVDVKSAEGLYRELADMKLRIALTWIMEEDARQLISEAERNAESKVEGVSGKRTQERTLRLVDKQLRKNQISHFMHRTLPKAMNAAAVVVLVIFLGVSTALALSSTVRMRVMRFVMEIDEAYTKFSLQEDPDASFDIPGDWPVGYYPTFIPQGYSMVDGTGTYGDTEIQYQNAHGDIISLSENSECAVVQVDTEDAKTHSVLLNGQAATMVEKKGITTLIWSEFDRYYVLWADGDADFVMKIAENLRKVG